MGRYKVSATCLAGSGITPARYHTVRGPKTGLYLDFARFVSKIAGVNRAKSLRTIRSAKPRVSADLWLIPSCRAAISAIPAHFRRRKLFRRVLHRKRSRSASSPAENHTFMLFLARN